MLIDVAVLDSGVDMKHRSLEQYSDIRCEYLPQGKSRPIPDDQDICGHGTAVVGLIKQKQPQASILSLRIFDLIDGQPSCSESRLIDALRYIDKTHEVKVINISCDVVSPTRMHELKCITKKLADQGTVIVAAHENNGAITYPASFQWVIGVAMDPLRPIKPDIVTVDDTIINIVASGRPFRVPWKNGSYQVRCGSSFSCANVSALALKYLQNGARDINDVFICFNRDYPVEQAKSRGVGPRTPKFTIQRAVAFPCNKEIHSVIRYANDLTFKLVDVYDIKQSFRVGRSTREVLGDENIPEYITKNIGNIEWDSFDTLILGCVFELIKLLRGTVWLQQLLEEACKRNKNIYAFEEISSIIDTEKYKDKIFYPVVSEENMPPYRGGRLFRTAIPILGVYGTSSQQGKFTLQMLLRKEFQKIDCDVGQIGTEPNALLFGMDYVFPMGYNGSIYVNECEKLLYVNDLLRRLCERNPDIIIVGSQMGTVPSNFGNLFYYCDQTYAFLQGIKPDYAIVMLSLTDSDQIIRRTINFLESLTETKTLAFVVFPMCGVSCNEPTSRKRRITQDEYQKFKNRVEKMFRIPVYLLGSETLPREVMKTLLNELEQV